MVFRRDVQQLVTDLYLGIRGTGANVSVEGVECNGASRAGIWLQGLAANVGGANNHRRSKLTDHHLQIGRGCLLLARQLSHDC